MSLLVNKNEPRFGRCPYCHSFFYIPHCPDDDYNICPTCAGIIHLPSCEWSNGIIGTYLALTKGPSPVAYEIALLVILFFFVSMAAYEIGLDVIVEWLRPF